MCSVYTRTRSHPPLLCTGCDDEPSLFHHPCSLSAGVCSDFPIRQSFADVENSQDENSHREDDTCPDCGERGETESEFLCCSEVLVDSEGDRDSEDKDDGEGESEDEDDGEGDSEDEDDGEGESEDEGEGCDDGESNVANLHLSLG